MTRGTLLQGLTLPGSLVLRLTLCCCLILPALTREVSTSLSVSDLRTLGSRLSACQSHKWSAQVSAAQTSNTCTLTPELVEGPYYINETLFRSNITEGQPGIPLTLRVKVLDTSCSPLADAFVDIWSCNSTGYYSGYTREPSDISASSCTVSCTSFNLDAQLSQTAPPAQLPATNLHTQPKHSLLQTCNLQMQATHKHEPIKDTLSISC